ncbi:hypothetical protein SSS_06052 [Sarcoptes scabiei]|uniref:Uncharacterized protein n=1 Tax=Sarcoptes scabiei TaxID=52283 RepID=A0A834R2G3_SARSC|nr:hypothetical protein SSS_06052 [Sarcoptes scabiei]
MDQIILEIINGMIEIIEEKSFAPKLDEFFAQSSNNFTITRDFQRMKLVKCIAETIQHKNDRLIFDDNYLDKLESSSRKLFLQSSEKRKLSDLYREDSLIDEKENLDQNFANKINHLRLGLSRIRSIRDSEKWRKKTMLEFEIVSA